ncbi:site-specific DNA-adenine methylase [Sphingomonas sp. PP-F2F-A104-K0414]|uniref:DNA adenine methylase n=1 Tax=Sphingomonas sp. PP-F2F-A104-K0414 TaxID=2135661 RepID=UPI0010D53E2E|nr:DNA adenine methylase [Sphingomonas sp. PP-F2F-A104-K0414]TCP99119.1 site-specific DNA-adenine methylase [Sphingomonas sp. PP-F2F-A104-K0414]
MNTLNLVQPVAPAAGYIGGKRNLASRLVTMIERVDHDGYAEPFVGMGGIFLRRRSRPKVEVINDVSGDVVTFFRVLQRHYPYMIDMLRFRVAARAEFERLKATPPETLTDLERACRFLYLQRLAFGGRVSGRTFGVSTTTGARFNVAKLEPMLADIHERLAGVMIEQLSYADFIRRYDRAGMLFYLDPPYWGCEKDYGQDVFGRADFDQLAAQLAGIKGKFLLSINDTPGVRETFAGFHTIEADTTYTVGAGPAMKVGELIVSNFEIK